MGASASLHVGFEVTEDDFWETWEHTDEFLSCPKGHTEGAAKGKYCSECGGKFAYQERETTKPTHELRELAARLGVAAEKIVPPDDWMEVEPRHLGGLEIFCCDGYGDADTEEQDYALGLRLASTGDILHMEGADSVPLDKIRAAIEKVEKVQEQLGLTDRPVHVFLLASCSY